LAAQLLSCGCHLCLLTQAVLLIMWESPTERFLE